VPQTVHELSAHWVGIWFGTPEGGPHARLLVPHGDSLTVAADEQRRAVMPWPLVIL
jgi:hypothetical protein